MSWVTALASSLGCAEPGLRLILGQMLGYPLMLFYRHFVATLDTTVQHLFFFVSGLLAGHWVIGGDVVHSLYAVLGTYLILVCAAGTRISVIVSFIFNFGYLLVGYYYTESEGYDICWTMPHCVLCLKLIGLTFDCYDGGRAHRHGESVLSKDQKKSSLAEPPNLLEMLSHSFFIGTYFVGPQLTMRKYREFVCPDYLRSLPGSPVPYGFKRFGLSLCYMVVHVVGSMYIPANWPNTSHFVDAGFFVRLLILPIWLRIILAKYIFAWLVAEGVCVVAGLGFVEVDEQGRIDWSGCANIKVVKLETAVCFGNVIEAFNVNTNHWAAVYVYKRLKFLGSQLLSQAITLFFLAIWHGFHVGYYITFFNEFISVKVEREFWAIWNRSEKAQRWRQNPLALKMFNILGWIWVNGFLPHCFVSFALLLWTPTYKAYSHTGFFMYISYIVWWLCIKPLTKRLLLEVTKKEVKSSERQTSSTEAQVAKATTPTDESQSSIERDLTEPKQIVEEQEIEKHDVDDTTNNKKSQ